MTAILIPYPLSPTVTTICSTADCGREAKVRGMCPRCYQRARSAERKAEAQAKAAEQEALAAEKRHQWESMNNIERMEHVRDRLPREIEALRGPTTTKCNVSSGTSTPSS